VSAYGTDESRILGHLDLSPSGAGWSSLIACPSRYSNEVQDKHLTFSGSPNLSFTVQIDSSPREIKLNEPHTVRVTPDNVEIFQFFPPEDIAKTQLDVTVTSESADVPAYLKVSRVCKDVDKDDIDEVDYKGASLRVSFEKKGRITLSKVSVPPLTDSAFRWFIGISIKNATGDTPFNATKSVTLELKRSFDFSYGKPICFLVILSIGCGFLISLWASCAHTELCRCRCKPEQQHQASSFNVVTETNPTISDQNRTISQGIVNELSDQGEQPQLSSSRAKSTERRKLLSEASDTTGYIKTACCVGFIKAFSNWFKHGPKTYSYIAAIVGFMLMIGAGQFVFANWHLMKDEGDRDNCYYNDFCYRVSQWHDIPFNLMISNLVYIIHGLLLVAFIWCREGKNLPASAAEKAFSIAYAFAWAMIFEGLFSLVYHLCPSKLTFQFDTAFMFVIAGLIVISLCNGTAKNPVDAAHFFLYVLVPLLTFNYLGALRQSKTGLPKLLKILFFTALAVWLFSICFWAAVRSQLCTHIWSLRNNFCQKARDFISKLCKRETEIVRKTFLFPLRALCVILPGLFLIFWNNNLPKVFLFSCIAESVLAILIKYVSQCKRPKCKWRLVCRILYVVVMGVLWGCALYFFLGRETTDKVETPEKSRNLNHDCILLGFFDDHDLWHILSSHALLMTVYLVLFMSHK